MYRLTRSIAVAAAVETSAQSGRGSHGQLPLPEGPSKSDLVPVLLGSQRGAWRGSGHLVLAEDQALEAQT